MVSFFAKVAKCLSDRICIETEQSAPELSRSNPTLLTKNRVKFPEEERKKKPRLRRGIHESPLRGVGKPAERPALTICGNV